MLARVDTYPLCGGKNLTLGKHEERKAEARKPNEGSMPPISDFDLRASDLHNGGRGSSLPLDLARAAAVVVCLPALLGDLSHNNVNIFILFLVAAGAGGVRAGGSTRWPG
jgi:hypothetical protein